MITRIVDFFRNRDKESISKKESIESMINSDQQLTKNLIFQITNEITENIEKKNTARRYLISTITVAIAGLGWLTINSIIKTTITDVVENRINLIVENYTKKVVADTVDLKLKEVEKSIAIINLTYLSENIKNKDYFSNSEKKLLMDTLRKQKGQFDDLPDEIFSIINAAISTFRGSNNGPLIDEIYLELFGEVILKDKDITINLTRHYGEQYIISLFINSDSSIKGKERLESLINALSYHGYSEEYYIYLLAEKSLKNDDIGKFIKYQISHLSARDKARFIFYSLKYTNYKNWLKRQSAKGEILSTVYKNIYIQFDKDLRAIIDEPTHHEIKDLAISNKGMLSTNVIEWLSKPDFTFW